MHFDAMDVSSQDFDFDDIFTYDNPQRKLPRVVEVSITARYPRDLLSLPARDSIAAGLWNNKVQHGHKGQCGNVLKIDNDPQDRGLCLWKH